ncbi:hypothetical protein RUND412_003126 [Rhizina undulata]
MQYSSLWAAYVVVSSFLGKTSAQTYPAFDASTVDQSTKQYWCVAQTAACPLLCQDEGKEATQNTCYPDNLYYVCTCTGGLSPNLTQYSQTIPYFICTISVTGCVTGCNGDPNCANACNNDRTCGASDPTRVNVTSTATTAGTTATGTSTSTSKAGSADSGFAVTGANGAVTTGAAGSSASSFILEAGQGYGLGLVVAGIAAGAAFMGL